LATWAAEREELVRHGTPAAASAEFNMAADGESLLASGTDARLRVTVRGDLATAEHVVVTVPGVGNNGDNFDAAMADQEAPRWWRKFANWGRSLREAAAERAPGAADSLAVVTWLGYLPPEPVVGAASQAMKQGAANLVAFQRFLEAERPDADVTWICHSYGSLVCAAALAQADPDALVLLGSPGVETREARELATAAPVWAAQGGQDQVGLVRWLDVFGASFGPLPADAVFGARVLPCGEQDGHSDYFRPGSPQVEAMTAIALGDR
jgi:pimeloyl-ACP methyl ester carboxylesterase